MDKKREELEKTYLKIKKLQEKAKDIERVQKAKARKERTRKLIILGGITAKATSLNIDSLSIQEVENLSFKTLSDKVSGGTN